MRISFRFLIEEKIDGGNDTVAYSKLFVNAVNKFVFGM